MIPTYADVSGATLRSGRSVLSISGNFLYSTTEVFEASLLLDGKLVSYDEVRLHVLVADSHSVIEVIALHRFW